MAAPSLLHVTQVAPYRTGPAGVHGVLGQSTTRARRTGRSRRTRVPGGR